MNEIVRDPRVVYAKKIIQAIFGKSAMLNFMDVYLDDMIILAIVDDTTIYWIDSDHVNNLGTACAFHYKESSVLPEDSFICDRYLLDKLQSIKDRYYNYILNNGAELVASQQQLRNYENFENCISVKTADGAVFYKIPHISKPGKSYMIPIFTGFPSLSGKDQIDINVYNIDKEHLVIEMIIFKKKINKFYRMIFRTIKFE